MERLPHQIFVTGIGTGVGKTLVSAVLVEALEADYWKPVQCGNLDNSDTQLVQSLVSNPVSKIHPELYRLKTAASPHYAAKMEGVEIGSTVRRPQATGKRLIIEGAGGLMVPLNSKELLIDWIDALDVQVVLVVRNYLGSINHTLLSIAELKHRGIALLGIIFSGGNFLDNEEIISHFGQVPVIGRVEEAKAIDKRFVTQQAVKMKESLTQIFKTPKSPEGDFEKT